MIRNQVHHMPPKMAESGWEKTITLSGGEVILNMTGCN
jgi:hypothetical protein